MRAAASLRRVASTRVLASRATSVVLRVKMLCQKAREAEVLLAAGDCARRANQVLKLGTLRRSSGVPPP
jgi:hypothetical protein